MSRDQQAAMPRASWLYLHHSLPNLQKLLQLLQCQQQCLWQTKARKPQQLLQPQHQKAKLPMRLEFVIFVLCLQIKLRQKLQIAYAQSILLLNR